MLFSASRLKKTEKYNQHVTYTKTNKKVFYDLIVYSKAKIILLNYQEINEELRIWGILRHQHVVKIVDAFQDSDLIFVLCDNYGTITFSTMREYSLCMDQTMFACFAVQALKGITYLCEKGAPVYAIYPENICVNMKSCLLRINMLNTMQLSASTSKNNIKYTHSDVFKAGKPLKFGAFYSLSVIFREMKPFIVDTCEDFDMDFEELIMALENIEPGNEYFKNDFFELKGLSIFKYEFWRDDEIKKGSKMNRQALIYEFLNGRRIDQVYKTDSCCQSSDGYGPIFEANKIRFENN